MKNLLSGLLLILMFSAVPAWAMTDARMQVEVLASDREGSQLSELHANIQHATRLALPALWNRIIPRQAQHSLPGKVNALLLLQRATPTSAGINITFHDRRVFKYLKSYGLPYIEQEPLWSLSVELRNAAGNEMPQSSSLLQAYADRSAIDWGYRLDASGDSLILQWRWLDQRQVKLTVRGTSRLGEFAETRRLANGNPFPQLRKWLIEVLLRARDTHALPLEETVSDPAPVATNATMAELPRPGQSTIEPDAQLLPDSGDGYLLISIERQASLPEQILFEDDLKRDPRIINLVLRQVNRGIQQYRLHLKGSDEQWLIDWFEQRGFTLSRTRDGWVAR